MPGPRPIARALQVPWGRDLHWSWGGPSAWGRSTEGLCECFSWEQASALPQGMGLYPGMLSSVLWWPLIHLELLGQGGLLLGTVPGVANTDAQLGQTNDQYLPLLAVSP